MSNYEFRDRQVFRMIQARQAAGADRDADVYRSPIQADPVDRVACRVGDASCASAHASTLNRSARLDGSSTEKSLLRLQKQYGNRYVGQVLSGAHAGEEGGGLDSVERSIDQARGGGQGLDHGMRGQMESDFGADFGAVRVHTDAHAHNLNRALSARAFTTGQDVFFRHGEYNPGSSSGRELLAHELTHVVQRNGDGIQRKMTVSEPGDAHEVEADQMARSVMQREQQFTPNADRQVVSRQEEEEKETATKLDRGATQRQPEAVKNEDEEKKKALQMKTDQGVPALQTEEQT